MEKSTLSPGQLGKIIAGCALFALGFDLFLAPNGLNAGGISGIAMVLRKALGFGSVGLYTAGLNLPLFALGGLRLGKKFLLGSALGMVLSSVFIDLFAALPVPQTTQLLGAVYGGILCGIGMGCVFSTGLTTGGSDIVVRLLKIKWPDVPIGVISICFDGFVCALTGLAFSDVDRMLYGGIAVFLVGRLVDTVVYRFDFSKVALIITQEHGKIVKEIGRTLARGATLLQGEGAYSGRRTKVVLTAVKRRQVAQLKMLVAQQDPNAFIIIQEAHQVLGDGFSRYAKDAL